MDKFIYFAKNIFFKYSILCRVKNTSEISGGIICFYQLMVTSVAYFQDSLV